MSFNSTYRTLFELKFRHHYFLDEGEDEFNEALTENWMTTNLNLFNIREFMQITPTAVTVQMLKNLRGRYAVGKDNVSVAIRTENGDEDKPFISFDNTQFFDFLVELRDPYFENYTDITIDRTKLVMLSNKVPAASTEETAVATDFSTFTEFGTTSTAINVYFGDTIDPQELVGKFALIRIYMTGDAGQIDLTDGGDEFNPTLPVVTLEFDNRETRWRYINSKDGSIVFTTTEKPLTKFGYIKITDSGIDYPNPNANLIIEESGDLYSEIFI